jgi:hypothetical protein
MDSKLKHLEFIQGVINRLSTNSFLLKGWSVVLVSALFAVFASNSKIDFLMLAYIPAAVFWGLDGHFLAVERKYRKLYEQVRKRHHEKTDFSMDTSDMPGGFKDWASATISKTLFPFHGAILAAITAVRFIRF